MKVFVFGNPDLDFDSLPLRILPELKKQLPEVNFEIKDPNEEWDIPEEFIVIDTVLGIDTPVIFENLENFSAPPRVSLHDFDAYTNLKYLQKLGKIKKIKIIALPALPFEALTGPQALEGSLSNGSIISEKKALEFLVKTFSNSL